LIINRISLKARFRLLESQNRIGMSNFAYDFNKFYPQHSSSQPFSPRKRIRVAESFVGDQGNRVRDGTFHTGQGQSSFVPNGLKIRNSFSVLESQSTSFSSNPEIHGWSRRNVAADNIRRSQSLLETNEFPNDKGNLMNTTDKTLGIDSASIQNVTAFRDVSSAMDVNSEGNLRTERTDNFIRPTESELLDDSENMMPYSEYREQKHREPDHGHEASHRELIHSYDMSISRCHESVEIIRQSCGSDASRFDFLCTKLQEALEALDRLGSSQQVAENDLSVLGFSAISASHQSEFTAASLCGGSKFLSSLESMILPLVSIALKLDDRLGSSAKADQGLAESLPRLLQLQRQLAGLWTTSDHALKLLSHYSCHGAIKASQQFAKSLHIREIQEEKAKNPHRKWQQVKNDTSLSLADNNLDCDDLHENVLWVAYRNLASVHQSHITELMPSVTDSNTGTVSTGDGKCAVIHYRDLLYEERALKLRLEALEKEIRSKSRKLEHHQRCLKVSLLLSSGGSFEHTDESLKALDTLKEQANISGEIPLLKSACDFAQKAPLSLLRELLESSLKAVDRETLRQQEHSSDELLLKTDLLGVVDTGLPGNSIISEQMRQEQQIFLEQEIVAIEQERAACAETCRFLLYFAEQMSLQMFECGTGFPSQAESDGAKAKCHLLHSKANTLLAQVSKSEPRNQVDDYKPDKSLVLYECYESADASSSLHPESVVFRRCIECSRRIADCLARSEHILPDGTVLCDIDVLGALGFSDLNPPVVRLVTSGLAMLRQPTGPCHKAQFRPFRAQAENLRRKSNACTSQDKSPRKSWDEGLQLAGVLSEAIDWVLSGKFVSATVLSHSSGFKSQDDKRKHENHDLPSGVPSPSQEPCTSSAFHIAASHMRVRHPWARRMAVADLRIMSSAYADGERSRYGFILPLTGASVLDQQTLVVAVPDRRREHCAGNGLEEWARRFRSAVFEPIGAFKPDIILVFFDAFSSIPCGGSACSSSDRPLLLGWSCSALSELARQVSNGRIIFVRSGGEGLSGTVNPALHGLKQVIGAATGLTDGVPKLLLAPPGTNVGGPSWSTGLEGSEPDDSLGYGQSPDPCDRSTTEKKSKSRATGALAGPDGGTAAESGETGGCQRKPRIDGAPILKPREAVLKVLYGRPEGMQVSELVEAVQRLECNIDVKEGVNLRSSITHMLSVCSSGGPHSRSANQAVPTTMPERPRIFEKVWPGAPGSGTVRFRISKAWEHKV
jgi:hypothetical protein